ncbi:reticulon-like protein B12 isoform X1 [Cryptomeria japonica]|uniref:reticulon-like protein B12 isoform X1 n=1 Tax=Cryptomeria japonica TaxID=3369 RepID=UPI0027DA651F|nr:reticulon-like protein B12 isoform X1 [Cryptomeria japonica]XP_057836819.2 reticulon-like protein B12 isoform X1 [Cryptomeria japonica]
MAENSEQSTNVDLTGKSANGLVDKASEQPALAVSEAAVERASPCPYRLFRRERSVHQIMGGGKAADVILWRRHNISIGILFAATAAWLLFERSGYALLSLVANVLLLLIVILFFWANSAALLKRPPPPLPELELSEEIVNSAAASMRVRINYSLAVAHDIALGKDFKLFAKVVVCLWLLSVVGSWFNFLTLIYISKLEFFNHVFVLVPPFLAYYFFLGCVIMYGNCLSDLFLKSFDILGDCLYIGKSYVMVHV